MSNKVRCEVPDLLDPLITPMHAPSAGIKGTVGTVATRLCHDSCGGHRIDLKLLSDFL